MMIRGSYGSLFYLSVIKFFREDVRQVMLDKYLKNPDYNFEKVNRASLACGPLVKWAIAQVTWQLCYYFES